MMYINLYVLVSFRCYDIHTQRDALAESVLVSFRCYNSSRLPQSALKCCFSFFSLLLFQKVTMIQICNVLVSFRCYENKKAVIFDIDGF